MTSRPCPPTTFSLVGVWTSSALWHRSGRSTYPKTHRADPLPNRTDALPTLPNPHSTRHRSLAKTLPNPALAPPIPLTHAQATQPSKNRLSRLRLPLPILTIQTTIRIPATTAATSSLPWTRCPCSSKHSGSRSQSKACRTRNWQTCSLQPCRRQTRLATWTARQSSSGNNSITACTHRRCSNISRTSFSRAASNNNSSSNRPP